jgi:uncharacterized protein
MQAFTLLIKPSGSDCNIDCRYCFYKDRPAISPAILRLCSGHACGQGLPPARVRGLNGKQRMSNEVLERLVKDYMELRFPTSGFAWQGGEPTLMGLDFYKRAVELQKKYGSSGQEVGNSLQTNAILLNEKWCRFLHDSKFLVGISIDGPKEMHDYYRVDHSRAGTFDRVMRAVENCKEYKVEFNTLTLLNDKNVEHPDELFDFFIENGVKYLQFIPCVERDPHQIIHRRERRERKDEKNKNSIFAANSADSAVKRSGKIADFSITPQQYGEFLCKMFDLWYGYGPQNLSIRDFDSILSYCVTGRQTICTFDKQCSQYIVIEHTGDAFCCDFFVEPRWRLGNIFETPIEKLAASSKKRAFARAKQNLCNRCLVCRHLSLCRGGCMKDRAPFDKEGFGRESYFCESYKRFFDYAMPRFMQIAAQINAGVAVKTQRVV